MIFHFPLPLDVNSKSASGIRPLKMLAAFKELGFDVDVISGYSSERKRAIRKVKDKIISGKKYDFLYSESSTMPTVLTDKNHFPKHPFMDFCFFYFCKKNGVNIGLFYRDIYWVFDDYKKSGGLIKRCFAKFFYYYDLVFYELLLTKLYVPSENMMKYVPIVSCDIISDLPPGHDAYRFNFDKKVDENLKIFYVGGMSSHYEMDILFDVVSQTPNISLTICTRKAEWENVKANYPDLGDNIRIVHESGYEMRKMMLDSDIVSLYVQPKEYWSFASPVKLYEYLGNLKPILASEGTLAGEFVRENGIGWTIPYNKNSLFNFLVDTKKISSDINIFKHKISEISQQHTWLERAKEVAGDLSQ
ncbi:MULTISPECIES: hypothetical protein [Pseudoalteromonas]|nr:MULTISPECIES: hypothetical protein [Pseudoalteromonas]